MLDKGRRLRPMDLDFAHMGDIEQAHTVPDRMMLVQNAGVLYGHVPAAKIDHLRAKSAMGGIQWSRTKSSGGCRHGNSIVPHRSGIGSVLRERRLRDHS